LTLALIWFTDTLQPVAPGHSFLFGHLLYLKKWNDTLPKGAHYQYMFGDIARKHFIKEGVFYIDLWPMSGLFLTVVSPSTAVQATQTNPNLSMERPALLRRFFMPITGGSNLFDLPEKEWKPWRSVFSKGFNTEHILSLVPGMVKETLVYSETLRSLASKGDMFFLDTTTLRFTMDMIGKTILCVRPLPLVLTCSKLIYRQEH
jgi:cytochrome P450